MEINYKKVPDIMTSKDYGYLKDMFTWNRLGYIIVENSINNTEEKSISDLLKSIRSTFYDNMNTILDLIKDMEDINDGDK